VNSQEEKQEIGFARDLLLALEIGTKKEDKKLTDEILSRHRLSRPRSFPRQRLVNSLSHSIVEGPGFEAVFLDVVDGVRPFALMLRDVFGFLAKHVATTERRSSAVRVSLQGATRAFDFDLSGFPMEKLEAITRIRGRKEILILTPRAKRDVFRDLWDPSNCWKRVSPNWDNDFYDNGFFRLLSYANAILGRGGDRDAIARLIDPVVDRLTALSQILEWSEVFPNQENSLREDSSYMDVEHRTLRWSFPEPSRSILDREDTSRALRAEISASDGRDLRRFQYLLEGIARAISLWNQEDFHRRDHEDWLSQRLSVPFEAISFSQYMPLLEEEVVKIAAALEELVEVDRIESFEEEVRAILDFLRLPFWRDRWFLYELWTATYVLSIGAAAWQLRLQGLVSRDDGGLEWLLPGGVAKEPIAVFDGRLGSVECWSQCKTYHPTTGKGLEPDLRLARSRDRHEDLVVIENKDRIKPRRGDMEEILERYVTGTQAQAIWLVNYEEFTGPTHTVGGKWFDRLVFVESHFRPGEVSERFSKSLRQILSEELGASDGTEPPGPETPATDAAATVTLKWEKPPNDLDLHAWTRGGKVPHHIFFSNRGRLNELPYVQLNTDCRHSPGCEEMVVERIPGEGVEIAVHQFSGDGQLAASQASVEIRRPGRDVTTLSVPGSSTGRWWRICTFGRDGNIVIRNVVTTEPPANESSPIWEYRGR
jgi:hypothetical protein